MEPINCATTCNEEWGYGYCDKGSCACHYGHFGDDCGTSGYDRFPGGWIALQTLILLIYTILLIVSLFVLYKSFFGDEKAQAKETQKTEEVSLTYFNIQRLSLLSLLVIILDGLLSLALDPLRYQKTSIPYNVSFALFVLSIPLIATNFMFVISHWAEVYDRTTHVLKQEEMLQKINQKYQSNVTLEGVVQNIRFVTRLKIPFFFISLLGFLITFVFIILTEVDEGAREAFGIIYSAYFALLFGVETVGFLVYGNKLVGLMPKPLQKKMRKVTRLNSAQAGLMIFNFLMGVVPSLVGSVEIFMVIFAMAYLSMSGIVAVNLFVIASKHQLIPKWCKKCRGVTDSTNSSDLNVSTPSQLDMTTL